MFKTVYKKEYITPYKVNSVTWCVNEINMVCFQKFDGFTPGRQYKVEEFARETWIGNPFCVMDDDKVERYLELNDDGVLELEGVKNVLIVLKEFLKARNKKIDDILQ